MGKLKKIGKKILWFLGECLSGIGEGFTWCGDKLIALEVKDSNFEPFTSNIGTDDPVLPGDDGE